jgi:peptidoglycan/LPS O-acetylase OafA/YrhL
MAVSSVDTTSRANPHPFRRSFAVAAILFILLYGAVCVFFGVPASPEAAGRATGALFFPLLVGAVLTGWGARRSRSHWRWWRYAAYILIIFVITSIVLAAGRMSAEDA